jgi:hypothetical protein
VKAAEKARQVGLGDAYALVGDTQVHLVAHAADRQLHRRVGVGVFERVAQQVDHDVAQQLRVGGARCVQPVAGQ